MSLPIFLYQNIMTTGTVTATSSDASFPVSNVTNWKSAYFHKPSATGTYYINVDAGAAVDVDCFAVFSHNLTEKNSTAKLQWSADGATGWTDLTSALQKSDSQMIFDIFTSVNKRYFRVEVVAPTLIPSIGIIVIGEYMTMQRGISGGFTPAHMDRKFKQLSNKSETGLQLGNSVESKENGFKANFDIITPAWLRANWEPLIEHSLSNPLVFSWNHSEYPDDAVLVQIDVSKSRQPYKDAMYQSIRVTGEAWHELLI